MNTKAESTPVREKGVEEPVAEERPRAGSQNVPAYFGRRRKRGNEICQILIKNGAITAEQVRGALQLQEEQGGQIGQILVKMGILSRTALSTAMVPPSSRMY